MGMMEPFKMGLHLEILHPSGSLVVHRMMMIPTQNPQSVLVRVKAKMTILLMTSTTRARAQAYQRKNPMVSVLSPQDKTRLSVTTTSCEQPLMRSTSQAP